MPIQQSFNSGVLSRQVWGRSDLVKFASGARTMRNIICLSHGPASRRSGSEFIYGAEDNAVKGLLYGFEFSPDQAYMLEFCDLKIRFLKDGGIILKLGVPYELTSPYAEADLPDLDFTSIGDTTYIFHPNYNTRLLVRLDHDDWTITEADYIDGPFLADNISETGMNEGVNWDEAARNISTIDLTSELVRVTTTTSHGLINGGQVGLDAIVGTTELNNFVFIVDPIDADTYELRDVKSSEVTAYGSAGTSRKVDTVTSGFVVSDITGVNGGQGFLISDVGRLIAIYRDSETGPHWGIGRIKGLNSTTSVIADYLTSWIGHDFGSANRTKIWKLGAWSDTTGYPRTGCLDNERLWQGGTRTQPSVLNGSVLGVYLSNQVSDPLDSISSMSLILSSKRSATILWLESGNKFAAGTNLAEQWLSSATGSGAITPLSKKTNIGSSNGVSNVKPEMIGDRIILVQRHGKVIRELIYSLDADNFGGQELQVLAEHLTRNNTVTAMAYQRSPYKVIWFVRDDGKLLGLTYYPEQEVYGFHIHDLGGNGIVESIAVIPGTAEDELWMIVRRVINGSTVRYIERLHETFKSDIDTTDAFYVDSGLTYDDRQDIDSISYADPGVINKAAHGYSNGDSLTLRSVDAQDGKVPGEEDYQTFNFERFTVWAKTNDTFQVKDEDGDIVDFTEYKTITSATMGLNALTMSGLDHLEGETVQVLTDGYYQGDYIVTAGVITLDTSASVIHAGLQFISDLEPVPPQLDDSGNLISNIDRRISNINPDLYKTLGFKYGPDADNLESYQFADREDLHGQPAPLYDGKLPDGAVEIEGDFELDPTILIRQDEPLPLTVLSLITEVELSVEE